MSRAALIAFASIGKPFDCSPTPTPVYGGPPSLTTTVPTTVYGGPPMIDAELPTVDAGALDAVALDAATAIVTAYGTPAPVPKPLAADAGARDAAVRRPGAPATAYGAPPVVNIGPIEKK